VKRAAELVGRVRGVARIASLRGALAGAAFAVLAVAGGFLAASALDIAVHLAVPARAGLLAVTALLAAWLAMTACSRSRREFRNEVLAAREVENRFPELGRSLSTAVEYGPDPAKTSRYSSGELVEMLVDSASERSSPLGLRRAVRWRAAVRAAMWASLALAGAGLYAALLPHMAAATARRFFRPLADSPPPTWTVIRDVSPGDRELPRGEGQAIDVELAGLRPREVRLEFRGEGEPGWSSVEMSPSGQRRYSRTLARIARPTEYRVVAGDAESRVYTLLPVEEPRLESLRVRIVPPEYTGLAPEELPEGTGDVRAPVGTRVELRARAAPGASACSAELSLGGRREMSVALEARAEPREFAGSFTLSESGEYRVRVRDSHGRSSRDDPSYRLTALPDRAPQVRVLEPARDVMAARDQKVTIELEATDDWGVSELGLVHTLSGTPERVTVARPPERSRSAKASYKIELALRGFRGGEIVTYYPWALDNDGVNGPKESIGEVRFLRTYDEERYGLPGERAQRTPQAVREVERLISRQMELIRKTFDAARSASEPERVGAEERSARFEGLAADQDALRRDLDGFVRQVEEELARRDEDSRAAMREEEIVELHEASRAMAAAAASLRERGAREASSPQSEALAHLSRTRRILLSESGSSGARNAMESAGRRRESTREAERRRSLDEVERELEKLPPILQRQEAARRKLERLEDEPPESRDVRELDRTAEEERRLAEEARRAASRMGSASAESGSVGEEPERRLLEAAQRMESAAEAARSGDVRSAAEAAARAAEELSAARAAANRSLRQVDRERIQGAALRAEDLARDEAHLAASGERDPARAEAQEGLRREYESLREEVSSLAARAEKESRAEARSLREAASRDEARRTSDLMDAAARAMRGERQGEARALALAAAAALSELAGGLREAAREAASAEGRDRAELVRRTERLSKEAGSLAEASASAARSEQELAGEAERLRSEARELADAVSSLPSRGEESGARRAARLLQSAERNLREASSALSRLSRRAAGESAGFARDEAARAAKALAEGAAEELAKALAEAAASAARASSRQDAATDELGRAGARDPEAARNARSRAEQEERAAAAASSSARDKLSEAEAAATGLGVEFAELAKLVAERELRERLPERMGALAARLGRAEDDTALEREEAERLSRDARKAAQRLESLAAEAGSDEIRALSAAAADARRLAERLKALRSRLGSLAEAEGEPRSSTEAGEATGPEAAKEAASTAQELLEDSRALRRRLSRRARELVEKAGVLEEAEGELADAARRLSRNQPPRPTNALGAAAEAYQLIGDGLISKIERILKQREYGPMADEDAPPSFRDLVERYFRALSED